MGFYVVIQGCMRFYGLSKGFCKGIKEYIYVYICGYTGLSRV